MWSGPLGHVSGLTRVGHWGGGGGGGGWWCVSAMGYINIISKIKKYPLFSLHLEWPV